MDTLNKKFNVIFDTDPGVDDTACLIHAFAEDNVDIKLITTVVGNISIEKSTRNTLHILDLFGRDDIPVAKGATKALYRNSETAEFIHQEQGLGGYIPKGTPRHKLIDKCASEAIYDVIKNGDGTIIPIVIGPHTNIAQLLIDHPDIIKKIPEIIFMGGSPYGHPDMPDHISFNISCDPEAFKIVLESKIPLVMVPSSVGRKKAHLDEDFVLSLKNINDVGKLLYKMYDKYWEPDFPDKRIATNDSCAFLFLTHPEIFKYEKVDLTVNTTDAPGKIIADFNGTGHVKLILDADREKFKQIVLRDVKKLDNIKINFD